MPMLRIDKKRKLKKEKRGGEKTNKPHIWREPIAARE